MKSLHGIVVAGYRRMYTVEDRAWETLDELSTLWALVEGMNLTVGGERKTFGACRDRADTGSVGHYYGPVRE